MKDVKIHGVYRHFKGDYYIVEDVATHSETNEKYVIYRALYGNQELYTRPLDMFTDKTDKIKYPDADQDFRFELQNIGSARSALFKDNN